MQYLKRWRMHVALTALETEGATVAQLAERLGYRSEAASRARVQARDRRPAGRRQAGRGVTPYA